MTRERLLALGILAGVLGLIWIALVAPVVDAFAAQADDITQSKTMLAAYEARVAMRPQVEARLAALKSHEASNAGLTGGSSAELAAANIQNLMKALVEGAAGQVRSSQNLAPVNADGFQRIDIQYDITVPMTRLKDIAYRIETATPYLFLDGIDLRAPENWQQADPTMDPPNLDVRWVVHGYRWTGAR